MPVSFRDILNKYRAESISEREKGTKFEELMTRYFRTVQAYSSKFEWVKIWNDFPYKDELGSVDTGIDIVAKTKYGEYYAIQCKFYSEDYTVSKKDVDTFLATSGRKFHDDDGIEKSFSLRLIVATTNNQSTNAIEVTKGQTIPVGIITLDILEKSQVDWENIENGNHGEKARNEKYELYSHQKIAYDKAMLHYETEDRGRMIMACGTGKTLTSLRIAEGLIKNLKDVNKKPLVLFLVPSISLVEQTLWSWTDNADEKIDAICVCSDTNVGKCKNDDNYETTTEIGYPVISNPESIVEEYRKNDNFTVIFSTYQSIDSIIEAQQKGLPKIDFIVCDEAHRTTGVIISNKDESSFVKCHNKIDAKKRLYMTATPRIYGIKGKEAAKKESIVLCSMDDETIYGKEFYRLTFGEAIKKDLLSDYKVLILTTTYDTIPDAIKYHKNKKSKEINADTDCKIWGCLNALAKNVFGNDTVSKTDPGPMKSAVAFSRSINVSKALTERINELSKYPLSPIKTVKVEHIDGLMNANKRQGLLDWLKENTDSCHILSNVRCLSEGVDVPALDAVMFMDAKGSFVDVVQSVGRVMRKADGKKYGYIIIPVVIPKDENPEEALDSNENYKVVWQVLRALRSHDERLEAEINTFQYNKDNKRSHICIGMSDCTDKNEIMIGQWTLDDFEGQLYAKLVEKVGDRNYIENWAKKVAEITPELTETLTRICESQEYGTKQYKPAFKRYLKGLKECISGEVSESQAIDTLTQQIITKPIFEELFGKDGFVANNPVSKCIDEMLKEIDAKNGLKKIQNELDNFYNTVKLTLEKIDTTEGKQKVITALYEKFFKNAFPEDQSSNGVVYTPQEIVDFIIRSSIDILKRDLKKDINDKDVNILDPFTGRGTFIARLLELEIITRENLLRKYKHELFANEITLLAYYIAAINIENTFQPLNEKYHLTSEYEPFKNIVLTDTFNIEEICQPVEQTKLLEGSLHANKEYIKKENETEISIIMGNPPYGAFNDETKKRSYDSGIDKRISETYLDDSLFSSKKGLVNSVYNNYIRAIRWSTDRIKDDGIISFVIPNGWLTSAAFEGFRKCIEKEFSSIYIFNLRGNKGTTDEMRRIEGRNVFEYSGDGGCTVGISIILLVKKAYKTEKTKIYYADMCSFGDRLKGFEKRDIIKKSVSFSKLLSDKKIKKISPKQNGDWITERNELFNKLIPIACDTRKKFEDHSEDTIFVGYSCGFKTNRDVWSYNFSHSSVSKNMKNMIEEYNSQLLSNKIDRNNKIKWDLRLENHLKSKKIIQFDEKKIETAIYRPFTKKWFYNDPMTINSPYHMPRLFPNRENTVICCPGIGVTKEFSCLVTNINTDLEMVGKNQCFPLYWYEFYSKNKDQTRLFDKEIIRHDGISDYALKVAQNKYGNVKKEDIFYYIYGYLHSKDYRSAFSNDLKYSLPRISFVDNKNDFYTFSEAGRKLADLHINYEKTEPYKDVKISISLDKINEQSGRIYKMKLDRENRKIICNQYVTIENIPEKAFQYIVNGRSALEWVVNQYQYYKDKEFGIVDNPNDYDGCKYIIKLILSLITVSVKTIEIVENLPKLDFNKKTQSEGVIQ